MSGKFYDSDADSDNDDAVTGNTPVGDKRTHDTMKINDVPKKIVHPHDDSPTDSDTDIQPEKKVRIRPPSTAGKKPARPQSRRPPSRNNGSRTPGRTGDDANTKTPVPRSESKVKDMYIAQNRPHETGTVSVLPDVFASRVMDSSVMDELEKMCGPTHWINLPIDDVPLYQREDDDRLKHMLASTREYEEVRGFAIIQWFLNKLKPSGRPSATTPAVQNGMYQNTELIPREYEEKQLRTPRVLEAACRAGPKCVCFEKFGFVMKEFVSPSKAADIARTGRKDAESNMCLVCLRHTAMYLRVKASITGIMPAVDYLSQSHSNIVNEVGEYTLDYCLEPGFGIIDPIVINYWPGYRHVVTGTEHVLQQVGYEICTQAHIDNLNFR